MSAAGASRGAILTRIAHSIGRFRPYLPALLLVVSIGHLPAQQARLQSTNDSAFTHWVSLIPREAQYGFSQPVGVALDAAGNTYVAGTSLSRGICGDRYHFVTVKYDRMGEEVWVGRFCGTSDSSINSCNAVDFALDGSGNVYVTGTMRETYGITSIATVKYDPSGQRQWAVLSLKTPEAAYDCKPEAMAVDSSGCVYVTGWVSPLGAKQDLFVIKYSPSGVEQWIDRYDGPRHGYDRGIDVTVNPDGNAVVTGDSEDSLTVVDVVTILYDHDGNRRWVVRYDGPDHGWDNAAALAIDRTGNIVVTAYSSDDVATVKYSPAGTELWAARFDGPVHGTDYPAAIAVDNGGNVLVTGSSQDSTGGFAYTTIKYSPQGEQEWVARFSRPEETGVHSRDFAFAIAVDPPGCAYVTGTASGGCATVKYSPLGQQEWVAMQRGSSHNILYGSAWTSNSGHGIAVNARGDIAVGGRSDWFHTYGVESDVSHDSSAFLTIMYSNIATGVDQSPTSRGTACTLEQNYPNPFNPDSDIRYGIPEFTMVRLAVYDILGREVALLVNETKAPGVYQVRFDGSSLASGAYIYRLQAGTFVQSRTLVLLK